MELEICVVVLLAMMISSVSWSHYYLWTLLPAAFLLAGRPHALAHGRLRIVGGMALLGALPPVLNIRTDQPLLTAIHSYFAVSHYLISTVVLLAVLLLAHWRTVATGATKRSW